MPCVFSKSLLYHEEWIFAHLFKKDEVHYALHFCKFGFRFLKNDIVRQVLYCIRFSKYIIRDYFIHECVDHLKNDLGSCWLLLGHYLLYTISDWNLFAALVIALTFKWVFSYEKIHSFYVVLSQIILTQNNQAAGGIMLILCSFSDCKYTTSHRRSH